MKNIKTSVFIATLALWLFGGIACAAELLQCPTELSVKQTIQGAIPEWQSFNSNQKHPYIGVSFSEGPPDCWRRLKTDHLERLVPIEY